MSAWTYADAGVSQKLGDDASKVLYNAAKITWENRKGKLGEVVEATSDFSGLRAIKVGGLPEGTIANIGFDGVGTKMEIAERLTKHDTIAHDLFAMVCDDAVRFGAEPVLVGSVLDVNTLTMSKETGETYLDFVKQLAHGYIGAATAANVAVVNGEIAELGTRVNGFGPFNYNWSAGVLWFARQDRIITGKEIAPGQEIVALRENGFRSNGLSLVRKIMTSQLGKDWHEKQPGYAHAILKPSEIYSGAVSEMTGGALGEPKVEITGIAHITGGGIPGKLSRILKVNGFGASLDDLFPPSQMMYDLQNIGGIADEEAYRTWNMGNGMLIVTKEPYKVVEIAQKQGIGAQPVGVVTKEPVMRVESKGVRAGQELQYKVE